MTACKRRDCTLPTVDAESVVCTKHMCRGFRVDHGRCRNWLNRADTDGLCAQHAWQRAISTEDIGREIGPVLKPSVDRIKMDAANARWQGRLSPKVKEYR